MKHYQKTLLFTSFLLLNVFVWAQGSFQLEEGTNIEYRTITTDVNYPWEILWGDDGMLWVTEKGGGNVRPHISRINPTTGAKTILYTPPAGLMAELNAPPGLLGMAFHPNFDANNPDSDPTNGSNIVYITFTAGDLTQHLARLTYDGSSLSNLETLVQTSEGPGNHGSRLIITNDNKLLWSTGSEDAPHDGQNLDNLIGKTLRVNLDGSAPQDNPYYTTADAPRSKVFTYGHRNSQGIAQIPSNHSTLANFIYSSEHGGTQNDEVNLLNSGNNYGWSSFEGYCTSNSADNTCPLVTFDEAPTGLLYYNHSAIPEWNGSLLMGTSKGSKLIRLLLNESGDIINKDETRPPSNNIDLNNNNYEFYFADILARPRAMAMSPDGKLYVASLDGTSDGSVDRIFVIENPDFTGCESSGSPTCQPFSISTSSEVTICDAQSLTIELSGSEQGATYELNINGNPSGITIDGSGCNINFELTPSLLIRNGVSISDRDVLTIVSSASGCTQTMTGSVTVNVSNTFSAQYYPIDGTSEAPEFQGLTYQWYNDDGIIANATSRQLENSTSDARVIVTSCNCSVWAEAVDNRNQVSVGYHLGNQFVYSLPINTQLDAPWAIEYGQDDHLWITERDVGQVLRVDPETGTSSSVLQLGANESFDATSSPRAGLMGMAIDWSTSPASFYLAYTYNDGNLKLRISSFEYNETSSRLENENVLVEDIPSQTNHGSALLLDNGYLYATTGSVDNNDAQEFTNLIGKVLRIDLSNPSSTTSDLIYSYGHRNPQGLVATPDNRVYSSEHGEVGGDELNLIQEDLNYGWPSFRGECTSSTPGQNECPELVFGSVAPGGLAYYPADGAIEELRNSILMANLRAQSLIEIPLTNSYDTEGQLNSYIGRSDCGIYGRLRDVAIGLQGEIYLLANGNNSGLSGGIIKLSTSLTRPPLGFNGNNSPEGHFSAFPNPTSSILNLSQSIRSYKIFDLSGAEVFGMELANPTTQIDISFLSPGIYFLKSSSEASVKQIRIIKE